LVFTDSNNFLHIRVHTLGYVHFVFTYSNNPIQVLLSLKRHSDHQKNPPTSSLPNYNEEVSNSVRSHGHSNLVADPLTN